MRVIVLDFPPHFCPRPPVLLFQPLLQRGKVLPQWPRVHPTLLLPSHSCHGLPPGKGGTQGHHGPESISRGPAAKEVAPVQRLGGVLAGCLAEALVELELFEKVILIVLVCNGRNGLPGRLWL